jgi:hypothetical protein
MKLTLFSAGLCLIFCVAACERKPAPPPPVAMPEPEKPKIDTSTTKAPTPDPTEMVKDLPDALQGFKEVAALLDEFYGKWRKTGSDGGMDGRGDRKATGEIIVITKKNEIETWVEGKLVSTVKFRAARGRSIFANDSWHISRGPVDTEVVVVRETDKLTISENHPDGYGWSYERVR